MRKELITQLDLLKVDYSVFLSYLKATFPLFHNSNFFFRDLQYGLKRYLEKKEVNITYPEAELFAKDLAMFFEEKGVFERVNSFGWRINYPEFVTQVPGDPL